VSARITGSRSFFIFLPWLVVTTGLDSNPALVAGGKDVIIMEFVMGSVFGYQLV
jgi:hypothetical protein